MKPARIDLCADRALVIGHFGRVGLHAHAAGARLIGIDGDFAIRVHQAGESWSKSCHVVIRAGCVHELDCGETLMGLLYLAPGRREFDRFAAHWGMHRAVEMHHLATPKREREELRAILSGEFPDGEVARWIMRDLGEAAPSRHFYDPRIARLVDEISRAPEHEFSIIELAARAGLSPSRVSHLFRDEIGLSPGKMHMWQRLRAVSRDFAHHRSLTRAAQVAGFFDSAHLSHAFRKSFGIAPSRLLARETSILDHGAV